MPRLSRKYLFRTTTPQFQQPAEENPTENPSIITVKAKDWMNDMATKPDVPTSASIITTGLNQILSPRAPHRGFMITPARKRRGITILVATEDSG